MSTTPSISTFVGSVLRVVSPNPNCPYPLYPHVHTVPSPFSATVWLYPLSTLGFAIHPSLTTFTTTVAVSSVSVFVTSIHVLPYFTPVTTPFSSTVAIFGFADLYV